MTLRLYGALNYSHGLSKGPSFGTGREQSRCGIWLGGLAQTDELFFSDNGVGNGNSYNESMSVRDDGYSLYLEPMGITYLEQQQETELTHEGAAEYFWNLFVERLK